MLDRPKWIKTKISCGKEQTRIKGILKDLDLSTVCSEAACPNKSECWQKGHLTFIILGEVCTRNCFFCNVSKGTPLAPDLDEPRRIAEAVKRIGTNYIVITSTTRDDLFDGGSSHFYKVVESIKKNCPKTKIELLIPDFNGEPSSVDIIASSGAEIIGHNIEMPKRLYSSLRKRSDYARSLSVLKLLSQNRSNGCKIEVKSSMIIGLGETMEEVRETLLDVREAGTDIVFIGQYLSPTGGHCPVEKYYSLDEFKALDDFSKEIGFSKVKSGPLVRSSYML